MKKIFLLFFIFLTSCQSLDNNSNNDNLSYIKNSNNNDFNQNKILYVFAQNNFKSKRYNEALEAINKINFDILNRDQLQNIVIIKNEILLLQGRSRDALADLKNQSSNFTYSNNVNFQYIDLLSRALKENGFVLDAIQERILVDPLLDNETHLVNIQAIWDYSLKLRKDTNLTGNKELDGYIDLSKIYNNPNKTEFQYQYKEWLNKYPNHQASHIVFKINSNLNDNIFRNIAFILPESENMLETSNAIKNGFESYMNEQLKQNVKVPNVTFFKEEDIKDLNNFYKKLEGNFDLVLGPLSKKTVRELSMKENLPIKTLALNYADRDYSFNNLYQYGLKVEDESVMIANKILEEGFKKVAVIMKKSAIGSWNWRVFESFQNNYRGEILKFEFKNEYDILQSVAELLKSDIDSIFIVGDISIVKHVRNSLLTSQFRNYPTWTISHVNTGVLTNKEFEVLNGIKFFDIPYLLLEEHSMTDATIQRVYAMGKDIAKLVLNFKSLVQGQNINGSTGELILVQNSIRRTLTYARFTDNKIEVIK